jgi:hypothetical protein
MSGVTSNFDSIRNSTVTKQAVNEALGPASTDFIKSNRFRRGIVNFLATGTVFSVLESDGTNMTLDSNEIVHRIISHDADFPAAAVSVIFSSASVANIATPAADTAYTGAITRANINLGVSTNSLEFTSLTNATTSEPHLVATLNTAAGVVGTLAVVIESSVI